MPSSIIAGAARPRLFIVDAFSRDAFGGNPAAVVVLPSPPRHGDAPLQALAMELNLSETAFVWRDEEGSAGAPTPGTSFRLRWFTPTLEVDLCGHATLATAAALFEHEPGLRGPQRSLEFSTRSGVLRASRRDDGQIELDFPADDCLTPVDAALSAQVAAALHLPLRLATAGGEGPEANAGAAVCYVARGVSDVLVEVSDANTVRDLAPDLALLAEVPCRGVIVTAAAAGTGDAGPGPYSDADFVSRFFGPRAGIPEDPVTGSAHCTLAPHWGTKLGKSELVGRQLSKRGGIVGTRVGGDGRVALWGPCTIVASGEVWAPLN